MIVIDHPHVGQITAERCLAPLGVAGREAERAALTSGSVGQSYPSYNWQGRQWAFPIDAASQVQAWRPGSSLRRHSPGALGRCSISPGKAVFCCPLRPPHALMVFYTLAGNLGHPCAVDPSGDLIDIETGSQVFEAMREIAALVEPACFEMDPIAVSERMAEARFRIVCAPLIYGYVSYAISGFRRAGCALPSPTFRPSAPDGPIGSALGGTGIAVSALFAGRKMQRSTSPIGSPAAMSSVVLMPPPADSPATPPPGKIRQSTRR